LISSSLHSLRADGRNLLQDSLRPVKDRVIDELAVELDCGVARCFRLSERRDDPFGVGDLCLAWGPTVTDPEAPPIRPERHIPNSIATIRRCPHLAREGAHVIVNARSNQAEADAVVREAQALGVRAISIIADMAKKDQVEAMAAKALSEFGRVDILINNAAIRPHMPFRELTDEDWEHVRNVVLDGALYLTRALIGPMVENKYGNILFFVGDGAYSGRGSGRAHLSAAKMALVGLARGLASEFAPHNIRVNVVSPGSIDTRRDNPEWYGNRPPDAAGIPLGRQGKIDEIAATCLFLVSDGGGFITGQTIHVNGGAGYY